MDKIHNTEYPWISAKVDVKEYSGEGKEAYERAKSAFSLSANIGILKEGMAKPVEFMAQMDPQSLKTSFPGFDLEERCETDVIPPEVDLSSINYRREEIEKRRKSLARRQCVSQLLKYRRINHGMIPEEDFTGGNENGDDVILKILVFRPHNKPIEPSKRRLFRWLSMDSAYLVRGQNTLWDLKNAIKCVSDHAYPQEISGDANTVEKGEQRMDEDKRAAGGGDISMSMFDQSYKEGSPKKSDVKSAIRNMKFEIDDDSTALGEFETLTPYKMPVMPVSPVQDSYKGCCFYLEGTFYNLNEEGCTDLSEPILRWATKRADQVGPFQVADMQSTKFVDLNIRLGQTYLYIHQGSCEHIIVATDLRMMSADDCQDLNRYPIVISPTLQNRNNCCACKYVVARKVVFGNVNDDRMPFDPSFWCDYCYKKFNFKKDGTKIGDFKAYEYKDRAIIR